MKFTLPYKIASLAFLCIFLGFAGVLLPELNRFRALADQQFLAACHQELAQTTGRLRRALDQLGRSVALLATASATRQLLHPGEGGEAAALQLQALASRLTVGEPASLTLSLTRDGRVVTQLTLDSQQRHAPSGITLLCCTAPPPAAAFAAIMTPAGLRLEVMAPVLDDQGRAVGQLALTFDPEPLLVNNEAPSLIRHIFPATAASVAELEPRLPGLGAWLTPLLQRADRGESPPPPLDWTAPDHTLLQIRLLPLAETGTDRFLVLIGEVSRQPVDGQDVRGALFALMTALLMALLMAWTTFYWTRPLRKLSRMVEQSATDQAISHPWVIPPAGDDPLNQADEVGQLARAFYTILERLTAAHARTRQMAENLERQVTVRTSELEEALHQARAGEQSRSEFLSLMSHELRTPLNQNMGMLELIQTTSLTPQQQEYIQFAFSASHSLLSLLSDILDMARMETGNFELDEVDFDLRELVDGVAANFAPQAHAKGIELTAFLPTGIPTAMRGDPNRLRQIFNSLIGNSIKFSETDGSVEIHGGIVHKLDNQVVELMFEVRDSGIGISEVDRDRIFGLFSQVDGSNSRKYGGVGIGLSICRRLVEMMGGEIGVDENPYSNTGSIFYFSVCLKQQNNARIEPLADGPKNLRILVVGSGGLQLTMLENALTSWGSSYGHVAETTAARAILEQAAARQAPYQLVIYNQKSGQDGREDLAMLELTCPHAGYLLLSDRLDQALDQAAGLPGAAVCLKKPFSVERLYSALLRLLNATRKKEREAVPATARTAPQKVDSLAMADILVVDDQSTNLKLAQLMLARLGCDSSRVVGAPSGTEAMRHFRERPFHLVFMDCQMPILDGYQTTRELRQLEKALGRPRTPIVALTADATEDSRKTCLEVGMDDHQSKPINMGELHAKLQHYLIQRQEVAAATVTPPPRPLELDVDAAMESIGLPEDAYAEVAELIVVQIPQLMESLEEDLRMSRYEAARAKSHVLKGSMANTLFPTLKSQTQRLHGAIRDEHWGDALHGIMTMRSDFIPIHRALTAYVQKCAGGGS